MVVMVVITLFLIESEEMFRRANFYRVRPTIESFFYIFLSESLFQKLFWPSLIELSLYKPKQNSLENTCARVSFLIKLQTSNFLPNF